MGSTKLYLSKFTDADRQFYVSVKDGSDSNDGSSVEKPWATLEHAVKQLRSTWVRGGTPSPTNRVTLNIVGGTYYLADLLR